jgi:predicted NBD/HSP70 family sugar kinase
MQRFGGPWPALTRASRSVVLELLVHGPLSRAELSRRCGLSPATLTRITKSLVAVKMLSESESAQPLRTGRPSTPLAVNPDLVHVVGVNLTRSAMTLVRTDLLGRVLHNRVLTLRSTASSSVIGQLSKAVSEQAGVDPLVRGVGVSLAGPVSAVSPFVRVSPFLGWTDVDLVTEIEDLTGLVTVVENDVRALTAVEHWFGGAAGVDDFVLITVGAGVACGVVVAGRLIDGVGAASGQIGHLPITSSGPLCERGHRGCARSYLASSSIIAQVEQATGRTGLDYQDVLSMAASNNPIARRVVEDAGYALGQLIGTVASVTGAAKVLVSGEGIGFVPLVMDTVVARAAAVQHWTATATPIEVAAFTPTEWARGAAVAALRCQLDLVSVED